MEIVLIMVMFLMLFGKQMEHTNLAVRVGVILECVEPMAWGLDD